MLRTLRKVTGTRSAFNLVDKGSNLGPGERCRINSKWVHERRPSEHSANAVTFADAVVDTDVELEVATDDSELPDSDPGDPGLITFFRFRGRPFSLGAGKQRYLIRI